MASLKNHINLLLAWWKLWNPTDDSTRENFFHRIPHNERLVNCAVNWQYRTGSENRDRHAEHSWQPRWDNWLRNLEAVLTKSQPSLSIRAISWNMKEKHVCSYWVVVASLRKKYIPSMVHQDKTDKKNISIYRISIFFLSFLFLLRNEKRHNSYCSPNVKSTAF